MSLIGQSERFSMFKFPHNYYSSVKKHVQDKYLGVLHSPKSVQGLYYTSYPVPAPMYAQQNTKTSTVIS